jgi:cation-transporting ATPase E
VALVAAMGVAFLFVLIVPWLQHFFALKLMGTAMPWTAVGIAGVSAAVLEFLWRRVDRRFPA